MAHCIECSRVLHLFPSPSQDLLQPPASLLDYLPLAHYCNGLLSAFNELRLCPALGLVHQVTERLRDSLTAVVGRVVDLYHTVGGLEAGG